MDVVLSLIAGATLGTIFTYLRVNKGKQELRDSLVEAKTRLEHEHEQAQTEEETKKSLETIFETTAQEALEKNSEKFIKVAQQTLKTHEEFTKRESKTLTERVAALQESVQRTNAETRTVVERLEGETTSLTKALTTPKIVGDWGEMQLKNLMCF